MAQELTFLSDDFSTEHAQLLEALYAEAHCERWGLSRQSFDAGLRRSTEKRFQISAVNEVDVATYLRSLHLEDLALACACSEGIEAAWEFFIRHFRQDLRGAARAMLRDSGSGNNASAEELADSLYAELYGIRSASGGRRKSLFECFHGRSKLSTWLRAVLAQRHVDMLRTVRRTVSLDIARGTSEDNPVPELARPAAREFADPDRARYLARIDHALTVTLAGLAPRERLLLSLYYIDQRTLAEIGKTLGEHESTISRQLERTRRALREAVTDLLRRAAPAEDGRKAEPGLDDSQLELAFEYALEDWAFDLPRTLSKAERAADPPEK